MQPESPAAKSDQPVKPAGEAVDVLAGQTDDEVGMHMHLVSLRRNRRFCSALSLSAAC